jgi:adenosylcobyric acid synthase
MKDKRTKGRTLSILGTGSDVGKSIVVTAFCRVFANRGVAVAPFKAQNMSNNSYVTLAGGEMGRAQVVQAQAARLEPTVDMNPVLLKPSSDTGAQVVVRGKPVGNALAKDYFANTDALFQKARESLEVLRRQYELVIMEGAGSCAEVNLRSRDFVNFRMAHAGDAPVLLVADIDKGGVFAQIVGTLECLPPEDRARVRGFIVNRFRGDASLFDDGIDWLQSRTGLPVLGLIPHFYHIEIDSEDGMPLDTVIDPPTGALPGRVNIAVIRLPHISNFTDFNPLIRETAVSLHYLARPRSLSGYDLLILPGSKNVRADLEWLRDTGWVGRLESHHRAGGRIGGVCGGYQMLGRTIHDPHGIEGVPGDTAGLGLLPVETTLHDDKTLTRTAGTWAANGLKVDGYEIHMGRTRALAELAPAVRLARRNGAPVNGETDGHRSADGLAWGTYLHGLFDEVDFRHAFLRELRPNLASELGGATSESVAAFRDRQYDLLAEHFERNMDMDALMSILGEAGA